MVGRMSGAPGLAVAPVAMAAGGPLVGVMLSQAAVGDYTTAVGVGVGAAAIVIALVQALKMAGLPSRYAALVSVAVGVLYACLVHWANLAEATPGVGSWGNAVAVGISLGLGASGLYSGTKAVMSRVKDTAGGRQ